jgi:hypothetical protein
MNKSSNLEFLGSLLAQVLMLQADNRGSREIVLFNFKTLQCSSGELGAEQNRSPLLTLRINRNVD